MSRSKKITLFSLLGVLAAACIATFIVSRYEEKKEIIKNSDEIILSIPYDSVTALAWEYGDTSLSFARAESWTWSEDEAFPVDEEKIAELLSQFEEFGVSFIIESADDLSLYGLNKPEATITIEADENEYVIKLGDYSVLDSERYVSIGDGNVYLVKHDPLEDYEITIEDLILDDVIPDVSSATKLVFDGNEKYTVEYEEESTKSCCPEDIYFAGSKPLDTSNVNSYLSTVRNLSTDTYVSYNVTEEELSEYGLDSPELKLTITYPSDTEEDEEAVYEDFILSVGRNQEELAEAAESDEDEEDAEENVTAYFRIGESQIVYQLSNSSYEKLIAASYNDLRHKELITASFDEVYQLDFKLEGKTYSIISAEAEDEDEDPVWSYNDREDIEITEIRSAISNLYASKFTDEAPSQKEEISLTLYLNNENFPEIQIALYRYDGESCIAQLDGKTVALLPRSQVVDLIEAVNGIILDTQELS